MMRRVGGVRRSIDAAAVDASKSSHPHTIINGSSAIAIRIVRYRRKRVVGGVSPHIHNTIKTKRNHDSILQQLVASFLFRLVLPLASAVVAF